MDFRRFGPEGHIKRADIGTAHDPRTEALLAKHFVRPLHQSNQVGRRNKSGVLAGEVIVSDRTGP